MLGRDARRAVDQLVERVDDPEETRWVRVQSADALGRAGSVERAVEFLGAVAGDEDEPPPTRLQAVRSLMLLGPAAVAGRDGLTAAAAAADEYVASAGVHALRVVDGTYAPEP